MTLRRLALPASLALLSFALATLASCERRTELIPASADSSLMSRDSFTIAAHIATDRWESGDGDAASGATAKALLESIRLRPSAPWVERSRGVLDSLGIASEVAGGERAFAVNLFSRSDPDGRSWPFLFWRESNGPRYQAIEGSGLRLTDVAAKGFDAASIPADSAQAAVLWGKRAGGGQQPVLMVWKHAPGGRWNLAQTLGVDSLGGTGTGEFVYTDSLVELNTRTFKATPWFDECATCPHVYHERRYDWLRTGFKRVDDQLVPSPYSTFTALIAALVEGDHDAAGRLVVDPSLIDFARKFEWEVPSKGRWRVAPATDESALTMVFFRGGTDAFRVTFEPREGDWVVAGFEPTQRAIE